MKFKLEFDMGNAAFSGHEAGSEVARILHSIAGRVESFHARDFDAYLLHVRDVNGNIIGEERVTK